MRTIAEQVWREPAAAIGLLTSVLLALIALISDAELDAQTLIGIVAPFASAIGIRGLVSPAAGPREPPA